MSQEPTKKELRAKIETFLSRTDSVGMHSVGRALVHLKNRQTDEEVAAGSTKSLNGRGFQPIHAEIGTSMALQYESKGYLSAKQVAYWQGETERSKKPRICRYAGQLVEEAQAKLRAENKWNREH